MITYTITVPRTVGKVDFKLTAEDQFGYTFETFGDMWNGGSVDLKTQNMTVASSATYHTDTDGGWSYSNSAITKKEATVPDGLDDPFPLKATNEITIINCCTFDSDGGETYSETYSAKDYGQTYQGSSEGYVNFNFESSMTTFRKTTVSPCTVSILTTSTSIVTNHIFATTTETSTTIATGYKNSIGSATFLSITSTSTNTTIANTIHKTKQITHITSQSTDATFRTFDNNTYDENGNVMGSYEASLTGVITAPSGIMIRDTATVIEIDPNNNRIAWQLTVASGNFSDPYKLTEIATSYSSKTTLLPIYKTTNLNLLNFAEQHTATNEPPNPSTISFTTLTAREQVEMTTVWELSENHQGGQHFYFPLSSREIEKNSLTTTIKTFELTQSASRNDTESFLSFGTKSDASCIITNHCQTYHIYFNHAYTSKRLKTFSLIGETSSQSAGRGVYEEFDEEMQSYVNKTRNDGPITSVSGKTKNEINGDTCLRLKLTSFSPCSVFNIEKSFWYAWGGFGANSSSSAFSKITLAESALSPFNNFAEIRPNVSIIFPLSQNNVFWNSSTTWTSESSSFSAQILGDTISKTTFTKNSSKSGKITSSYVIAGEQSAWITQITNPQSFNFGLSCFGPFPALESITILAMPGTYVSIKQDSLGNYTFKTTEFPVTSSATISKNVVLFPAANSFYTTSADGIDIFFVPRNR